METLKNNENLKTMAGCLTFVFWNVLAVVVGIVTAQVTGNAGYGVAAFLVVIAIMLSMWTSAIREELKKGSS